MIDRAALEAIPAAAAVSRGGRLIAVNARFVALTGRSEAELLGSDPFELLLPAEEAARIRARNLARERKEAVPFDYEVDVRHPTGQTSRARIRASVLEGGEGSLLLVDDTSEKGRSARLIRSLGAIAVALQREMTEAGVLRRALDELKKLGLTACVVEVADNTRFRLLIESEPGDPIAQALRQRGSAWIDSAEVPGGLHAPSPHGLLIDDVPGLVAALAKTPRAELAQAVDLRTVVAAILIEGHAPYAVAATGPLLDATVASAFGLFGRQLGTAIETVRRLDELARRNRELMLVNHVARATATLGSGFALQSALDHVADAVSAHSIALFRREDEQLTLAVSRGFPFGWATSNSRVPMRAAVPWAEAAASREMIHYSLEGDVAIRRAPRIKTPAHGVPRLVAGGAANEPPPPDAYGVAVPLQISDRVHGVLLLARRHPAFGSDELELLATVSAQLAVNLQNEVLFDQSQRRVSELSLLLELGQAVVSTLELDKVLTEAARVAARMLRCSAAYVMLPDDTGEALVSSAGADPHVGGALVGTRVPLGAPSMSGMAFRTLKPQATNDPGKIDPVLVAEFGCLSTLAVPLHRGQKPLGVLCLIERSAPRIFEPQELRLATHAANLISVALENARLYAEERARAEELARASELSRSLVGAVELQPILQQAARMLSELLDASNCFILLYEEQKRELRIGVGPAGDAEFLRSVRIPIDAQNSLSATALRERRPMQAVDAASSPYLRRDLADRYGEKSVLALPLYARERPIGAVVIDETRRERTFTPAEIERAQALCAQIGLALLAARLVEDLRHSYDELARTQAELVERERLAVVGELSASIAHEVRNPLGVIFNSLGTLRKLVGSAQNASDVRGLLDIIGEEADRLNRMVGDLLDFARPLQPAVQSVAIEPLLRDAIEAARAQHGPSADLPIEVRVAEGAQTVRADPRLLRQAVVNLVLNALQAANAHHRGSGLRVGVQRSTREGVPVAVLTVADEGPGVPEALRPRIFQPFFTTKAQGTGLGLALVKRIVEGHGGSIGLAERPEGKGAEFVVTLPLE